MSRRVYFRIMNICLAAGIAIVLLFDNPSGLNWFYSALLAIVGAVAGITHFLSRRRPQILNTAQEPKGSADSQIVFSSFDVPAYRARMEFLYCLDSAYCSFREHNVLTLIAWNPKDLYSENYSKYVVDLVERLSSSHAVQTPLEVVTLTPEGHLTIRFSKSNTTESSEQPWITAQQEKSSEPSFKVH